MPRVGFERTIPASERTKTVHALIRVATVIGVRREALYNILKEFMVDMKLGRLTSFILVRHTS
jgi:hypothetical protein